MKRYFFRSPSTDPFFNLAFENWILNSDKFAGSQVCFVYRNQPCLVVGRNQNVWAECNVQAAKSASIPILRRFSGGGAVVHDLGNWNYSLHADREVFSRSMGAELIIKALDPTGKRLFISPRHDILMRPNGAKVSGSAYKISRSRAYHHGTLLLESNLSVLLPLLRSPLDILPPDEECAFGGVSSVRAALVANFDSCKVEDIPSKLITAFEPDEIAEADYKNVEIEREIQLLQSPDWIYGKSPAFKVRLPDGSIVKIVEGRDSEGNLFNYNLFTRV